MKNAFLILLFLATFSSVHSQEQVDNKIKALKIAFITEHLDLTEAEAQKFWPIYNAFEEKERKLRDDTFMERRRVNPEDVTEEEAKMMVDEFIKIENERHQLKQKFIEDLRKVLPAKKLILLRKVEDDFKRKMFEELRMRRKGRP